MAVTHAFTSAIEDGADETVVQPSDWNAAHTLSNALGAIDGLTPAASKILYFTGADSATLTDITATGISLLGAANAAGARTTLELGTIATQAANNVSLTGGSISGMTSIGGVLLSLASDSGAEHVFCKTNDISNSNQSCVFALRHYSSASEESATAFRMVSESGVNQLYLGGGALAHNACTMIKFYSASNNKTLGGSERGRVTNGGRLLWGATTDNGVDALQVNGTIASKGIKLDGTVATDQPTYSAEFLDGSNWTSTGWTGSFATGWSHTTGNTNTLVHDHAAVSDTKYQIAYTVTGRTAGTFTISFGGQTSDGISATGAWGPTATATDNLSITPTSDFNGTISISIKSITGISAPAIVGANSSGTVAFEARVPNSPTNVFTGVEAGSYNTTGSDNVATGRVALYYNTTGSFNIATGRAALYYNTTGSNNVATGRVALYYNTTGSFNIATGRAAGQYISGGSVANTTSNNSVYLGALTRAGADGNTNEIVIGFDTTGMGSNTAILGNSSITHTYLRGQVLIGTTTSDGVNTLQVNGTIASTGYKLSALNTAPASASATGTLGEIRITADAIYICTATNTWKKCAIATW